MFFQNITKQEFDKSKNILIIFFIVTDLNCFQKLKKLIYNILINKKAAKDKDIIILNIFADVIYAYLDRKILLFIFDEE